MSLLAGGSPLHVIKSLRKDFLCPCWQGVALYMSYGGGGA
jgi:hypothetical protein